MVLSRVGRTGTATMPDPVPDWNGVSPGPRLWQSGSVCEKKPKVSHAKEKARSFQVVVDIVRVDFVRIYR
jgi:hypothetical protein